MRVATYHARPFRFPLCPINRAPRRHRPSWPPATKYRSNVFTRRANAAGELDAAHAELAELAEALAADDVFSTDAGRAKRVYQHEYLPYTGLWRTDPHSPIGQAWLRASGHARWDLADLERQLDVRADGPDGQELPS
jgi:hypothetical protein